MAMTFNEGLQIDPNRVSGGGGPGLGGGLALGGGALGIIAVIVTLLLGGDPGSVLGQFTGADSKSQSGTATLPAHCKTGADANKYVDCRVILTVQSLDGVWGTELPKQTNRKYVQPKVTLFSGAVNTGCGQASSAVGPFYCPADQTAYFDTSFFQELVDRFGSSGGPLAQEYVVAHEFGHHIQNLLGDINRSQRDPKGATSAAVRTELQADCYSRHLGLLRRQAPCPGQQHPVPEAVDRQRHPRRALRGVGRRRRPHPEGLHRPRQPGGLDPRLLRRAPEVVPGRIQVRSGEVLRHLLRAGPG